MKMKGDKMKKRYNITFKETFEKNYNIEAESRNIALERSLDIHNSCEGHYFDFQRKGLDVEVKEIIRGILVEPFKEAREYDFQIDATTELFDNIIGNNIREVKIDDDLEVVAVCSDSNKNFSHPINRYIGDELISGPFAIVGKNLETGEYKVLPIEKRDKYYKQFDEKSILLSNEKLFKIVNDKKKKQKDKER